MSGPLENGNWERFCWEYIKDFNGGRAYERVPAYTPTGHVADVNASRLLTNADILARIEELRAEQRKRLGVDVDRVLKEYVLLSYSDIDHYRMDDDANVVLSKDAPEGALRALSSVKRKIRIYRRGETDVKEVDVEIKLWNKNTALQDLGKHLGLFGADGSAERPLHERITIEIINRPRDGVSGNVDIPEDS